MAEHQENLQQARNIATESISESTQRVYLRLLDSWKNYCQTNGIGQWAATSEDFIGFLQHIYKRSHSVSSVYQHLSAVSFFYRLRNLDSPAHGPLVAMYIKGLKRQHLALSGPVARAKPMTLEILKALNDFLLAAPRSLRIWRTIWRINLAFFCLLRWDDVSRLKVTDFELVNDDGVPCYQFQLSGGKTIMERVNPIRRLYSHPDSPHCPLKLTLSYFGFLEGFTGSVVPQCQANRPNSPHETRSLSYTNAVEDLRYVLRLIGVDPKGFSEHSMKRGGATEAAKRGATVHEIQDAGHWTNAATAEKYIDDSHCRTKNFSKYFL